MAQNVPVEMGYKPQIDFNTRYDLSEKYLTILSKMVINHDFYETLLLCRRLFELSEQGLTKFVIQC